MKDFIIYLFETSVCISVFWIVYELLLKRETFFSFLRVYFLTGIVFSIILPFFHYTYDVIITTQSEVFFMDSISSLENTPIPKKNTIWQILAVCYFAGLLFITICHLLKMRKIFQLSRYAKLNKESGYVLIDNSEIKCSFSIFKFIFINTCSLNNTEKNAILQHEIQHIKQNHWIDLFICEILFLFQWFNPIVWKYISCIKNNHEYLADKAVIEKGVPVLDYKEVLISQTLQHSIYLFYNSFNYSTSKRLLMMSKKESKKWKKALILILLPLFGVLMWVSAKPHYVISQQMNDIGLRDSTINSYQDQRNISKIQRELLIIDGKEYPSLSVNMLDSAYIESISYIDPKTALNTYGKKGENGVVNITLKKGFDYSALDKTVPAMTSKLFIVDGQIVSEDVFNLLNPSEIISFEVLPNDYSVYGEAGKNGLVVVRTKE